MICSLKFVLVHVHLERSTVTTAGRCEEELKFTGVEKKDRTKNTSLVGHVTQADTQKGTVPLPMVELLKLKFVRLVQVSRSM